MIVIEAESGEGKIELYLLGGNIGDLLLAAQFSLKLTLYQR